MIFQLSSYALQDENGRITMTTRMIHDIGTVSINTEIGVPSDCNDTVVDLQRVSTFVLCSQILKWSSISHHTGRRILTGELAVRLAVLTVL